MKKNYNCLDVLKFVMALLIVMIHVQPNQHSEALQHFFYPFLSIAVPVFFVCSSILLFKKIGDAKNGRGIILHFCKRLGLLYVFWLLIDSWFIIYRKSYFQENLIYGAIEFIKDLFLGTTFPGSWFLSALFVSVVLVYSLSRIVGPYITMIISLLISCYFVYISALPDQYHGLYNWYAETIRPEVRLSFPANMIWVSIGQLIGLHLVFIESSKKWLKPLSVVVLGLSYAIFAYTKIPVMYYLFVISICLIAFLFTLPDNPIYQRLRNYSILMYLFHFSIAGKMNRFCAIVGDTLFTNYLYYFIVIVISIYLAELILRSEKKKYFRFLKYTH